MLSKLTIKTNLLQKLLTVCGVIAGSLSVVPAWTQSTLAQSNSVPAPIVTPLSNEDPSSYLNRQSQPIPDTVTPTTTAPSLSVPPLTTTPTLSVTPFSVAPAPLATPQTIESTTPIVTQTLAPALSIIPTTTPPASTAVLTTTDTSTTTESTPVASPITPTP